MTQPKHDPEIRNLWREASRRYRAKKKALGAQGANPTPKALGNPTQQEGKPNNE